MVLILFSHYLNQNTQSLFLFPFNVLLGRFFTFSFPFFRLFHYHTRTFKAAHWYHRLFVERKKQITLETFSFYSFLIVLNKPAVAIIPCSFYDNEMSKRFLVHD